MVTSEQKEINKQYILAHLDEYTLDVNGDLVKSLDVESEHFCIYKGALDPEFYREIKRKLNKVEEKEKKDVILGESILADLENWELVYDRGSDLGLKGFRHKTTGREVGIFECDFTTRYKIASELGRDQNLGETYEEIAGKIGRHSMRKNFPQDQIQISDSHSESILDNKQKNDVSLSPKPKSQQNFEKENDGYLNDNELLKLIISAESLVKQNKHDDYILSIFVKEKERNTSSYKFLNKNGRIYNLIQEMEKNRQQQKKTIAKDKSIIKSNFSMIIFFIFLLAVGGFALKLIIKKRKSNKVFYY